MRDRAARAPQSGDLTRAKTLRRALKRGASPDFIPPAVPNPPARPSALSWYSGETHYGEATPGEKYPGETPRPETSGKQRATTKHRRNPRPSPPVSRTIIRKF